MNTVTTVMAFSVSAFFVLFVFVRLLCAPLHLRTNNAAGDAFVVQTYYNVERGIHGLEPSVVATCPTVKLDDGAPGREESQCTVCLEEYAAKDVVRVLPACGHAAWLRQHPSCPVCRATTKNHHQQLPPSSSGVTASPPHQADTGSGERLEILVEEPGSSDDRQQSAGVVHSSGCGETAGRSPANPEC